MGEIRRKRICLDLSMQEARKIREKNKKEDSSVPEMPNRVEWLKFGNLDQGVVIPDKGFTKQLHQLDEELEVAWDWGSEKWEIWKFPKNGKDIPYHVMTVQTRGRSYRELGADVLLRLQEIKQDKFSAKKLIAYLEELDNQERRRKLKAFMDEINDIANESFINIHCKLIQVPKEFAVKRAVEA